MQCSIKPKGTLVRNRERTRILQENQCIISSHKSRELTIGVLFKIVDVKPNCCTLIDKRARIQ